MNAQIDVTKLPGYRPQWGETNRPPEPPEEKRNTVAKIISPRMARKISAAYRCAACWSELVTYWHTEGEYAGKYTIECSYCGSEVPGFVTRSYIAHRIEQNEEEYRMAREAMQNALPFLFPDAPQKRRKLTADQNLKELGF